MGACGLPNEFCFMQLHKGSKVIGVISALFSLIFSILLIYYLCSDFDQINKELNPDDDVKMSEKLNEHRTSTTVVASLLLTLLILYFVASVFLVKGVNSKSKKHLFPFLVCTFVLIIATLIISLLQFGNSYFYMILTLTVILIYFFLCIYALYQDFSIDY